MIGAALYLLGAGLTLPPHRAMIAERVAAVGMSACSSYEIDGAVKPCLLTFRIGAGIHVNARSDGMVISFTRSAIVRLSDDEFALLTGHELAHTLLGHRSSTPANELAADRLGAEFACKAGFNSAAGITLFRYLAAGKTHPPSDQRKLIVLSVACPFSQG